MRRALGSLGIIRRVRANWMVLSLIPAVIPAAILGTALLPGGTNAPRVIEAEEFVLRDATGRARLRIGTFEQGSPYLFMLDEAEKARVSIELDGKGRPAVGLWDGQGERFAELDVDDNDMASLTLEGREGNSVIVGLSSDGTPGVSFWLQQEKHSADVGLLRSGTAYFTLDASTGSTDGCSSPSIDLEAGKTCGISFSEKSSNSSVRVRLGKDAPTMLFDGPAGRRIVPEPSQK